MRFTLELACTAYTKDQLAVPPLPQVALAGRSNVGKSSLINRLAGRKALAKVSATPGKTRSVNYFTVTPGDFYLVDLPGYGYAKAAKTERAAWAGLIEKYLAGNRLLKAVAVLLDSRLPPQRLDVDMVGYLARAGIPIVAVLTKADKCKQAEVAQRQRQWAALLPGGAEPLAVSSKTGKGVEALWAALSAAAGEAGPAETA
ncbi:MAG: ribosome biogenesis GTP-binding protein YihA/YsxC [Thermodesulfobacteriota bacterium]